MKKKTIIVKYLSNSLYLVTPKVLWGTVHITIGKILLITGTLGQRSTVTSILTHDKFLFCPSRSK